MPFSFSSCAFIFPTLYIFFFFLFSPKPIKVVTTTDSAPARSILQQPHVSAYGSASQPTPIIVQPSPRPVHRSQSRINNSQHLTVPAPSSAPGHTFLPSSVLQDQPPSQQEQVACPMCALDVNDRGLICDRCNTWLQLYTFETISDHLQYQGVRKRTLRIVYLCN